MRYTGYEAIEKAEKLGLKLNKYNDPIEGAREGLTVDEAKEIAQEDPGLIWVEADEVECECGMWLGEKCNWSGPESETVVVEWMPVCLRSSHIAAGNSGIYPHNGSVRVRVEKSCAKLVLSDPSEQGWVRIPRKI